MKTPILLMLLNLAFTAGAQTSAQRDSAHWDSVHRKYHLMRRDPKQNNPYAFADSAKAKKVTEKSKKKTR